MKLWISRILKSKTMMFNILVAGMTALEPVFGTLQAFLPGNVYAYISVFLAVGNAMLRVITTQPLSDK